MQTVSALYKRLWEEEHTTETKLLIAGETYMEDDLISMKTSGGCVKREGPELGCCISRTIDVDMFLTSVKQPIPKAAILEPFVRLTNGWEYSEWLPKGKFYIDTRQEEANGRSNAKLRIRGFDKMMMAEQPAPIDGTDWPARDAAVVQLICRQLGVTLDPRTANILTAGYEITMPIDYSSREVLSGIGVMYGGSWIINDAGLLQLVQLSSLPEPTSWLITETGAAITFGGVKIIV